MKISIAIITKNEEERLPDCLRSVAFADDILVVDSGSDDRTVQVAQSFGARILSEPWRGYSDQKQFAVDQCLHDWVLILDADERVPEKTAVEIGGVLRHSKGKFAAFSFRRKNYLHGRWIRRCGWWPDRIVRLVNRRRGRFDGRPVHEKWVPEGEVMALDAVIEHISFRKFSDLVSKMETYSNLSAEELAGRKARVNALAPLTHGIGMFLKTYFFELGLLDGFDGLVISVMNAGGSFLKYAKLREMIEHNRRGVPSRSE